MKQHGQEVLSALRLALAEKIGADRFALWFGSHVDFQFQEGRLHIIMQDAFRAERIRRAYWNELNDVSRRLLGPETTLEFRTNSAMQRELAIAQTAAPTLSVTSEKPSDAVDRAPVSQSKSARHETQPSGRADEQREFVVGEEHRVAMASLDLVLSQPGKVTPMYIYGPPGTGKTHFLESIRRQARERAGLRRVVSVSAERFTTQFLEALLGSGLPNFRRKYRDVELLIVDDVHFFSGKKQTLVEFQNTIESMLRGHRQVILSADRSPSELTGFDPVLVTRMAGGLVCALPYPEFETRRRIAGRLAEQHGGLPDEVLDMVAQRLPGDARQLHGAVYRLLAVRQAMRGEKDEVLTAARALSAIEDLLRTTSKPVRLADIDQAVCEVFGIERSTLRAEDRRKHVSQPRMLAMWLARKHTRAGLSEICRYFGRRSHSTVVSAERQVQRWLERGDAVRLASGDFPIHDAIRRVESHLRTG